MKRYVIQVSDYRRVYEVGVTSDEDYAKRFVAERNAKENPKDDFYKYSYSYYEILDLEGVDIAAAPFPHRN